MLPRVCDEMSDDKVAICSQFSCRSRLRLPLQVFPDSAHGAPALEGGRSSHLLYRVTIHVVPNLLLT